MVNSTSHTPHNDRGMSAIQQNSSSRKNKQDKSSRVIEMKPKKRMMPSRDAVFFVQLFARAYRYSS